jgi:hypothetical protein
VTKKSLEDFEILAKNLGTTIVLRAHALSTTELAALAADYVNKLNTPQV